MTIRKARLLVPIVVGLLIALPVVGLPAAHGAVPDCAPGGPNIRTWIGPASGNWSTPANWSQTGSQPPTPGRDEIACTGNANVTLDVGAGAEVDAVVTGPDGTLSMIGFPLTLSPSSGEESQVANLVVGHSMVLGGAGDLTVTRRFDTGTVSGALLGGAAGSRLTLATSVGANANLRARITLDGRTLVVSDGVTVTQAAGADVSSANGASIENSGVWDARADVSVFSAGSNPGIFRNTATGVVRKTGSTGSTSLSPFENDGVIENQTTGEITLGTRAERPSSSDGSILTGPGMVRFNAGAYTIGGEVSGPGTVHVNATVTFTGSYAVRRTETGGGGSRVVFDTPSPQTLPQLAIGQTVAGSADLVVSELLNCNGCRIEGAAGSRLTLAASVGNATVHGTIDGRTLVVENGVTVNQPAFFGSENGGSVENRGVWNATGDGPILAPTPGSVFRNSAAGILRKTGGAGNTFLRAHVVNDGLIENQSAGTLSLGRFSEFQHPSSLGKISVRGASGDGPALTGSGRLAPAVFHSLGIVAPGASAGTIEVTGAPGGWELAGSGEHPPTLQIEIGGTGFGQFDKLVLAGPFTLPASGTTLALSKLPGYVPVPGDQFAIVEASSVTGRFATVTGTDAGNGLTFEVTYEADPPRIVVTVAGTAQNQGPTAVDDAATVAEDSGATELDVLANDTDPENDQLTIVSNTQPADGSASCSGSSCSFTPAANFNGATDFTYRVTDPLGNSASATVSVTVTPVNDDPVAADDAASVTSDSVDNQIDVLANDSDLDGDALRVTAVGDPAQGSAAIGAGDGSVLYTPDPAYNGPDSFTYTVSDGNGGTATATVSVTIVGQSFLEVELDAQPDDGQDFQFRVVGGGDDFALDDDGDGTLPASRRVGPLAPGADYTIVVIDPFPTGWAVSAIDCTETEVGENLNAREVSIHLDAGETVRCTFRIVTGFLEIALDAAPDGPQDFQFHVTGGGEDFALDDDGDGSLPSSRKVGSLPVGVDYTAVVVAPFPSGWAVAAIDCTETPVTRNLVAREVRVHLDPGDRIRCTFRIVTGFIEVAVDAQPNDAQDFTFDVPGAGSEAVGFKLDDDADGTLPAAKLLGPTSAGADYVILMNEPAAGWRLDRIDCNETPVQTRLEAREVKVHVDEGDTVRCTFFVVRVALPPDAVADTATVAEDSDATAIDVLANDRDPNGDALTITSVGKAAHGTVEITGGGSGLTYEPAPNYSGPDSFTYTISDGDGGTDSATVTIGVTGVNDPPNAVDDIASVPANAGPIAVNVLVNDTDAEGNPLTITDVTQGAHGAVAITGGGTGLTYEPGLYRGADSFTYTVSDDNGGSATAGVDVHVEGGSIEVVLDSQPDDPQDFRFHVNPQLTHEIPLLDDDDDPTLGASALLDPLPTGPTEIRLDVVPQGWVVRAIDCTKPPRLTEIENGRIDVLLEDADTIRCTFTLDKQAGAIEIVLDTEPDDPQDFSFHIPGSGQDDPILDDDDDPTRPASALLDPLPTGPTNISLNFVPQGWAVTAIDCTKPALSTQLEQGRVDVLLEDADAIRCTFTLDKQSASIEIVLDAQPDDPQDFRFHVNPQFGSEDRILDDDDDGTLLASALLDPLPTGPASISLDFVAQGWAVTAIDCTKPPLFPTDLERGRVDVLLEDADAIRCTFTIARVTGGPDAVDDTAAVRRNSFANSIDVLANDSHPNGDPLTIAGVIPGTGSVVIDGSRLLYEPQQNFIGFDSFTYTISDGNGRSDTATVIVTVTQAGGVKAQNASCASYTSGGAGDLAELEYMVHARRGTMQNVKPPFFRYFAQVPVAGTFTITVGQSTSPAFGGVLTPSGFTLHQSDCSAASVTATASGGTVTFTGSVATPTVFTVNVRYSTKGLDGQTKPSGSGVVTYTFGSSVNGVAFAPSSDAVLLKPTK